MKKDGIGGANTQTGIVFEKRVDLCDFLNNSVANYHVENLNIGQGIYFRGILVASSYKKHDLYKYLKSRGVDWTEILSKRLLPDDAIYVIKENTVFMGAFQFGGRHKV